jgi:hypothetical protein
MIKMILIYVTIFFFLLMCMCLNIVPILLCLGKNVSMITMYVTRCLRQLVRQLIGKTNNKGIEVNNESNK